MSPDTDSRAILWRRLDVPGHDSAVLRPAGDGAELCGMAVFHDGAPTALRYIVRCDAAWHATEAWVRGWRRGDAIDLHVRREEGAWIMNGARYPEVNGCVDLDLNFTPATNLLALRRLDLQRSAGGEVRSAWLEWPAARLRLLVQRYVRRAPGACEYEADLPDGTTFRAVLQVSPEGWVLVYGDLWRAEGEHPEGPPR